MNQFLNTVFEAWLWAFQHFSPTIQICALALPAAVLALLIFRFASNQPAIIAAKDKIKAYLLELRLYRDDLRVTLKAQGQVFRYVLIYMRHTLIPMTIMIVPFLLFIIQVESRYAWRSLYPGESAILTVLVDGEDKVSKFGASLELPTGLTAEAGPLRINQTGEILWRTRAKSPGNYQVGIWIGTAQVSKYVIVGDANSSLVSPVVYRGNDFRALAYPTEPALDEKAVASVVKFEYPRARGVFAGLSSASWIFFAASLVFGFALRRVIGVSI